jgi:LPS sulfotransferase NodH
MEASPLRRSFMICGVPRSGTTLLGNTLRATGLAGRPVEFFDPGKMKDFERTWKTTSIEDYVETMLARTASPNGVFGIKAHYNQLRLALGERDPRDLFPNLHFVYVTRRDRLRQAISWSRAGQTGKWSSKHAAKRGPPTFDFHELRFLVRQIEELEQLWEGFFAERGVSPLRLVYEDFSRALEATIVEVLTYVGIELPRGFQVPTAAVSSQTDRLSDEWVERYREFLAREADG